MARRKSDERAAGGRARLFAVGTESVPSVAIRRPPEHATPLRGRRELLRAIVDAFDAGARLVTLVGTAGIGKTRLVDHVAQEPAFASFVARACSLDAATTPAEGLAAIAACLGVSASAVDDDERQVAALGAALRQLDGGVVVLDGVDPLASVTATTIGAWLAQAPRARFLSTCRQPLRLAGEVVIEVPPLSPEDAIALFVDHARLARRDFVLTDAAQRAVQQIVELLDRIPLAIELAAARCVLLSPNEIRERLADPIALLRRADGAGTERHASLERAIAGSWELLSRPEQECLAKCAVFRGSFSIEAAESVLAVPGALDVVARLVDRSLLRRLSGHERTRLAMWTSVRAFANRALDEMGLRRAAEARHERYFLDEGTRWLEGLEGARVAECRARLLEELPELLEAFRRADGERPEAAVQLALVASPILSSLGPPSLHLGMLDTAVAAASALGPRTLSRVLALRGWARLHRGHPRAAETDLADAAAAARQAGDPGLQADALAKIGHLRLRVGRLDEARAAIDEALRVCRETGQERLLGQVLARVALWELFTGDAAAAERSFTAALDEHERHGDSLWMAFSYSGRGAVRMERGATEEALADFERALRLEEQLGDGRVVGVVSVNLGLIRHEQGDLDEAGRLLDKGLATLELVGHRRGEGEAQEALGVLALERGALAEAERRLFAAEEVYVRLGHAVGEQRVRALLGACAARAGRTQLAERHLRAAREGLEASPEGRLELPLVAMLEGLATVERARQAVAEGDQGRAAELVQSLPAPVARAPLVAHRIVARFFGRVLDDSGLSALAEARRAREVTVEPECRWFEVAGEERVSLGRRGAMRLVLGRLVALHRTEPGRVVDVYALFEAAWPGDRASPDVGAARVYESIRMLRRMGLRDVLLHRDGGYLIDPQVEIRIAHSKSTE